MLWVQSFHIISMVAWFAGLFYLPRLFVYQSETTDQVGYARFNVMTYKLYCYIMTPAAVATVGFGLWLISYLPSYYLHAGWMHAKLMLVFILLFFHGYLGYCYRQFAQSSNQHSSRFFRIINEFPTVILIATVILVTVKPF